MNKVEINSQQEVITPDTIRSMVIVAGINALSRSYDKTIQSGLDSYLSSNLKDVLNNWSHFDQNVKIKIIDLNVGKILAALGDQND